ncbi:response regulator [Dactylosporangium siamense]|uniref:DNA-binding response regulator n=1 Tax=Dactylosporangium siamense TaxID=685454 RepID=A0A919PXU9_9ACTN|nr:response regulator transcription factor [Dactylosporangium siamense]GIG50345.1 DNA-binding response regulator [Dactylosporangium siamense]
MIRVALADDQALVRMGLRVLISREPDLALVGEAADGHEALALVRRTHPDVVLLDIRMPGPDGLRVLRDITGDPSLAATHVVIVTTFETDEYVLDAVRDGASGFVLKDAEPADLVRAIRAAANGDALLSPSVTRRLVELVGRRVPGSSADVPAMDTLTEREREIVAWVATGRSNDEIAAELFISPATVRTHVGRAMLKLSARDRAQLVVFAVRAGLTIPRA